MSASVRIERVPELPEGQLVRVEPQPDGETIIFVRETEISPRAADGLGSSLTLIKRQYHATGVMHSARA